MGGGGGGFGGSRSLSEIKANVDKHVAASAAAFETELQSEFAALLAKYNARNTAEIADRLDYIKNALHDQIQSSFDTLFGGSVAKHTYVDGISDVDSMLVVSGSLAEKDPGTIIQTVATTIRDALSGSAEVSAGRVAITVRYPDGTEIQLVPTVEKDGRQHVPAWETNQWSPINPQQFRDGLTKRNVECGQKLIPTLKLAKAVNATLPEAARLTGYHIESLGVASFRDYDGEKSTVRMLPHFFKRASELVLTPMADRTGQSVHVDSHLGPSNSEARRALSHTLARIHQRMTNASASRSQARWREIMGE